VLSAIICRIRNTDGSLPIVIAYDAYECVWNPPIPLLFQRVIGLEHRPITIDATRTLIHNALANTGLVDTTGKPLTFLPHDFRSVFTTEAIMNGMPPHIAQLILGHKDINTTMGYKNPRELHQVGTKLQVTRSTWCWSGILGQRVTAA
jgi:integrase